MRNLFYFLVIIPALLQGQTKQTSILNFYKNHPADLFGKTSAQLPGKSVVQYWDLSSNAWTDFADTNTYAYNASGLPTLITTIPVAGGNKKTTYLYDQNDNLIMEFQLQLNGGNWDTTYINSYKFDDKNNVTIEEFKQYMMGSISSESRYQYIYTYGSGNQVTSRIIQEWFAHLNDYRNASKQELIYRINGEAESVTTSEWDTLTNAFVKDMRINEIEWQLWTGNLSDRALLKSYKEQFWNGTAFQPIGRFAATYDTKSNLTSEKWEKLDLTTWEIEEASKFTLSYNADSTLSQRITESWSSFDVAFVNSTKEVFSNYPLPPTGLRSHQTANLSISLYPNPASNKISVSNLQSDLATIIFTDIQGKVVSQTETKNTNTEIDIANLNKGIYFYTITDTKGNSAKGKLVVQ